MIWLCASLYTPLVQALVHLFTYTFCMTNTIVNYCELCELLWTIVHLFTNTFYMTNTIVNYFCCSISDVDLMLALCISAVIQT